MNKIEVVIRKMDWLSKKMSIEVPDLKTYQKALLVQAYGWEIEIEDNPYGVTRVSILGPCVLSNTEKAEKAGGPVRAKRFFNEALGRVLDDAVKEIRRLEEHRKSRERGQ